MHKLRIYSCCKKNIVIPIMLLFTVDFNYGISYDRISILSMISCNAVIRKNHIKSMVVPLVLIQRKTAGTCK